MRVSRVSVRVLDAARDLTIGIHQRLAGAARKVAALGLSGKVDAVVYASRPTGKPDPIVCGRPARPEPRQRVRLRR